MSYPIAKDIKEVNQSVTLLVVYWASGLMGKWASGQASSNCPLAHWPTSPLGTAQID